MLDDNDVHFDQVMHHFYKQNLYMLHYRVIVHDWPTIPCLEYRRVELNK